MPLLEKRLFETVDKVALAIGRLKEFEPLEGYWLAFSGGKDSTCIHQLAIEAGVKFTAHYNITTMDPPELIRHMHKHYPDLLWDKPDARYEDLLLKKGFPPMRQMRWCCEHFKESHGEGMIVTGIRANESRFRQTRRVSEACYKDERKHFINPILDWTTEDVWEFIRTRKLPYCELYDQGWKRIGCLFCPCAPSADRQRHAKEYPAVRRRMVRGFQRLVELRRQPGRKPMSWQTGEELFEWWIAVERKTKADAPPGQMMVFEGEEDE